MCNATRRFHALLILVWVFWPIPASASPRCPQSAQTEQAHDASQPAAEAADAPPPAAKKVWTNDDLSGLHNQPAISTGVSNSVRARPAQSAQNPRRSAAWYRDQILRLQSKLPPLDEQIAELHAAIDGKPTGDARKSVRPYSVRLDSWAAELDQLNKKRADISDNITELRDEARRNGIPANALP
jgi:hypothetical protein